MPGDSGRLAGWPLLLWLARRARLILWLVQQMVTFTREDDMPSWFANSLGKALSLITANFVLSKPDNTHVRVVAGADVAAAIVSVGGPWRWNEAPVTAAHPGGAAGAYPVFATAKANNVNDTPAANTDHTDYSFGLVILLPGHTPTLVAGVVDVYRQVGIAQWDGAKITRVDQTAPASPLHKWTHLPGAADAITPSDIGALAVGAAAGGGLKGTFPNPEIDDTWTVYLPDVHSFDNNASDGNSDVEGIYREMGGICFFFIKYSFGSTFNGGTGYLTFNLPPLTPGILSSLIVGECWLSTSDGRWWQGIATADAGESALKPWFPGGLSIGGQDRVDVQQMQQAPHSTPGPGGSIPHVPAGYAFAAGDGLVIRGRYPIAP